MIAKFLAAIEAKLTALISFDALELRWPVYS